MGESLWDVLVAGGSTVGADGSKYYWGPTTGINWCEEDYTVHPQIAEFWNTISNLSYMVAALSAFRQTVAYKLPNVFLLFAFALLMTGVTSMWFHCTLW
jgi:dihydroceramidase